MLSWLRDVLYFQFESKQGHPGSENEYLDANIVTSLLRNSKIEVNQDSYEMLSEFMELTNVHHRVGRQAFRSTLEKVFEEMSYNFCLACL